MVAFQSRMLVTFVPKVLSSTMTLLVQLLEEEQEVRSSWLNALPALPASTIGVEALVTVAAAKKRRVVNVRGLTEDARREALSSFERVLVVRNPFTRLYSAWHNKFHDGVGRCKGGRDRVYCGYWKPLALRLLRLSALAPEQAVEGVGATWVPSDEEALQMSSSAVLAMVTWPLFLRAVVFSNSEKAREGHWAPQVSNYGLCTLSPTHVITAEHADEDMALLLKKLGSKISVPHLNQSSNKTESVPSVVAAAAAAGQRKADRRRPSMHELFGSSARVVAAKYIADFEGLGYSTDPRCA
jgi:hypothetical protein